MKQYNSQLQCKRSSAYCGPCKADVDVRRMVLQSTWVMVSSNAKRLKDCSIYQKKKDMIQLLRHGHDDSRLIIRYMSSLVICRINNVSWQI